MRRLAFALAASLLAAPPALAAEPAAPPSAVTVDVFASSDADNTDVAKWGANLDWRRAGPDDYEGVRLELARFSPLGQPATKDVRAYYRLARKTPDWSWSAQLGSDGDTVLGALNVHNAGRFRQEYFLEREIVETPQGLDRGIYYTFAGGALDLPVDDRNTFTVVGAVQDFTGRNRRLHARATYVHVLSEEWGLTAQVRGRYFHSTEPREYDYFSPRNFVQVVPTLQLRRRIGGWRGLLAVGLGGQRETGGGWRQARAINVQLTSPPVGRTWALDASFAYSNTPVGAGYTYDYRQFGLGVRRAF